MSRSATCITARAVLVALVTLGVGSTTATAATYCLGDAACVAGGGTSVASLSAGVTAANAAPGTDEIRIGGSTTPFSADNVPSSNEGLRVVGAGRDLTTLVALDDAPVLDLGGSDPVEVSNLSVRAASRGVEYSGTGALTLADLRIDMFDAGSRGIWLDHACARNVSRVIVNAPLGQPIAAHLEHCASRISDSTFDGESPSTIITSAATTVARSTFVGRRGVIAVNLFSGPLEVVDSVLELRALDAGSPARGPFGGSSVSTALAISSNARQGSSATSMAVRGTTIVAMGSTTSPRVGNTTSAFNDSDPFNGNVWPLAVTFQGVVLAGPFTRTVEVTAMDGQSNTTTFETSAVNLDASRIVERGSSIVRGTRRHVADPGFVDVVGRDRRPIGGSPLIDAGPVVSDAARALDRAGRARSAGARSDIGAFEYQPTAPAATISGPATIVAGSETRPTVTAVGTDADVGETATLTYAWTLPDGSTTTGTTAAITAPVAPGRYPYAVRVTDVTGASSVTTTEITVTRDRTAPVVKLTPTAATKVNILARKPVKVTVTSDERATMPLAVIATVVVPARRRGAKPTVKRVTVATRVVTFTASGQQLVSLVPTGASVRTLRTLLAFPRVRITWSIAGTAKDRYANARAVTSRLTVR